MTYDAMGAWDYFRFQKVPEGTYWKSASDEIDRITGAVEGNRLNRWATQIGHQAPLYPMKKEPNEWWDSAVHYLNIEKTVEHYLTLMDSNLSKEQAAAKIVVGVPFYGRAWAEVPFNEKVFAASPGESSQYFTHNKSTSMAEGIFRYEFNCDVDLTSGDDTGSWLTVDFNFAKQSYPFPEGPLETCLSPQVPKTLKFSEYEANKELQSGNYMSAPGTYENGAYDYAHIKYLIDKGELVEYFDTQARVPFAYGANVKDDYMGEVKNTKGLFVSYDNPRSLEEKVDFVLQKNLGGVMFWVLDATHDKTTNTYPLLEAIHKKVADK